MRDDDGPPVVFLDEVAQEPRAEPPRLLLEPLRLLHGLLQLGLGAVRAFLEAGLVDRLLLFVAPTLSGDGPRFLGDLSVPVPLHHVSTRPVGRDLLVEAYVREP